MQEEKPGTAVTLTHTAFGKIEKEIILSATTMYQNKSVVSAPIPAFITEVLVQPGSRVKAGDVLYRIESKEQHALGNGNHAVIPIKVERDGIVLDVQQQAGSYVTEGAVLCSVAEAGSLVFEINVPYEQQRYAHSGSKCMLELPDGTRLTATVHAPLVTMNMVSQSERVIARAKAPFLPEGMNVKAVFTENDSSSKGLILPKSAVQSDETLTKHWVMKLADNGTAVRVPIEVGNSNAQKSKSNRMPCHRKTALSSRVDTVWKTGRKSSLRKRRPPYEHNTETKPSPAIQPPYPVRRAASAACRSVVLHADADQPVSRSVVPPASR